MKSVRFSDIVEHCGRPHVHALWMKPEADPEFVRARKADRVMTIETARGKTDAGFVGFDSAHEQGSQFLVFPKSLKHFDGARVVGIKFDLVDQPATAPATTEQGKREGKSTTRRAKSRASFRPPPLQASPPAQPSRFEPNRPRQLRPARAASAATAHNDRVKDPASALRRPPSPGRSRRPAEPTEHTASLVEEVRAALEELKAGRTDAAYTRLQHALRQAGR